MLETTKIRVVVSWNDQGNRNGNRPESVNVNFYENETFLKTEVFVADDTDKETNEEENFGFDWANDVNWRRYFELPTHKNGERIKYNIQAENIDRYTLKYDTDNPKDILIRFSQITDRVKIRIKKVWDDDNDRDGMRPDSMTVQVNDGPDYLFHPSTNGNEEFIDIVGEAAVEEADKITEEQKIEGPDHDTVAKESENHILYVNGDENKKVVVEGAIDADIRLWIRNGDGKTYGQAGKTDADGDGNIDEFRCWVNIEEWRLDDLVPGVYALRETNGIATINEDNDWTYTTGLLFANYSNEMDKQYFIYENPDTLPEGYECPENMYFLSVQFAKYDENGESIKKAHEEEYLDYENKFGYETAVLSNDAWNGSLEYGIFTFEMTNKHAPYEIEIPVTKIWDDDSNRANERPEAVLYRLYSDELNEAGEKTLVQEMIMTADNADPDDANKWTSTFISSEDGKIFKYRDGGIPITYTIEEIALEKTDTETEYVVNETYYRTKNVMDGYVQSKMTPDYIQGNNATKSDLSIIGFTTEDEEVIEDTETEGFIITNTYEPENIEIKGRVWCDGYALDEESINGILDDNDKGLSGIKVILKDAEGDYFNSNNKKDWESSTVETNENGEYVIKVNVDTTSDVYKLYLKPTGEDGEYESVRKRLEGAYIEFEYNANKYTTVANVSGDIAEIKDSAKNSKAIENQSARNIFDSMYSTVTPTNIPLYDKKTITASTKGIISFDDYFDTENEENLDIDPNDTEREITLKYGYEDGSYIETNPQGAWLTPIKGSDDAVESGVIDSSKMKVKVIQNVNLGLFEREQPDVAVSINLTEVTVKMNNQEYTYEYSEKSKQDEDKEIQDKFQNKEIYIYKRPINPADIASIKDGSSGDMQIDVTYEVSVANLSTTLPVTVYKIKNYYDTEYTLNSVQGWTEDDEVDTSVTNFKTATGNMNTTVKPGEEASVATLTYKVSSDAIKELLSNNATLNNAVEIESYSTTYGVKTLYAEQKTDIKEENDGNETNDNLIKGRAGRAYGGYDYDSLPGNSQIFYSELPDSLGQNINVLRSQQAKDDYFTAKGQEIYDFAKLEEEIKYLEDDTDFAPSFVLCLDILKTLSGTAFEDTDVRENDERVGDGIYSVDTSGNQEKTVQNVKVNLYEVKDDGTKSLATLYDSLGNVIENGATKTTNDMGNYSFEGVVTGKKYYKSLYMEMKISNLLRLIMMLKDQV